MDLIPIVRRALLLIGLRHILIHSIWTHLLVVEFAEFSMEANGIMGTLFVSDS